MNLDLDLGQWIVIGLSAFLLAWYFALGSSSRRRGISAYRWLRTGLETLGQVSDPQWIGSPGSGARVSVAKAAKPFRNVEAIYLLEPREFLPYWLFSRLQGRRDQVIIKAALRSAPKQAIQVTRDTSHKAGQTSLDDQMSVLEPGQAPKGFQIQFDGPQDSRLLQEITTFLGKHGDTLDRLNIQRQSPQLEIKARFAPLLRSSAEAYFESMQAWFQEA
ncbi:MAG: hypothetical protein JXA78_15610 [Anaerolineales bacterium]|nr:hypothetical protein [Anaerolineales bacterium]